MAEHSKLIKMRISNIGCVGPEGLEIELDNILTIVGANNTGKSTVLRAYELATGSVAFINEDRCVRGKDQSSINLKNSIERVKLR
jgi:ABC-type branched-subunit amino acid transport system ATPase component